MATSLAEQLNIANIIQGLAQDLADRRAGTISIEDARVRAELARQLLGALRLMVTAQKMIEQGLKELPQLTQAKRKTSR